LPPSESQLNIIFHSTLGQKYDVKKVRNRYIPRSELERLKAEVKEQASKSWEKPRETAGGDKGEAAADDAAWQDSGGVADR